MQEKQTLMPSTVSTQAPVQEIIAPKLDGPDKPLDINEALVNLKLIENQQKPDPNIYDDALTKKDRDVLLKNIVVYVDYLNQATLASGQKIVEEVWVENNKINNDLIDLRLKIGIDNFSINGTFDISILKKALSDISQNLPLLLPGHTGDVNFDKRQKAEQRLVEKDLKDKLQGTEVSPTNIENQPDEVSEEFIEQKTPGVEQLKGVRRFIRGVEKSLKLVT